MSLKKSDFRAAYVFDDVENLNIENPQLQKNGNHKQIILKSVQNMNIDSKGNTLGVEVIK